MARRDQDFERIGDLIGRSVDLSVGVADAGVVAREGMIELALDQPG